jgi:hypothetical protein
MWREIADALGTELRSLELRGARGRAALGATLSVALAALPR